MKIYYKDSCGTYSINIHHDGTATLRCHNGGKIQVNKKYKSEKGAKIALSKRCGGMPIVVND